MPMNQYSYKDTIWIAYQQLMSEKNSTFASNQRGLKRNKSIKPNTKGHEKDFDNNDDGSGRNDRNG